MAFGTGPVGAGLVIGSLLGGVIANSRGRRGDTAVDADRGGGLYLSHRDFYLHTARVLVWGWDDITTATMAKPVAVQLSGNSVHDRCRGRCARIGLSRRAWARLGKDDAPGEATPRGRPPGTGLAI